MRCRACLWRDTHPWWLAAGGRSRRGRELAARWTAGSWPRRSAPLGRRGTLDRRAPISPRGFRAMGATLGAAGPLRDGRLPPLHPREFAEGLRRRRVIWRRGSRHRGGWCKFGCGRPKMRRIGPEFTARGRLGSRSNARRSRCRSAGGGALIRPPPGRGRMGLLPPQCARGIPSRFRHSRGPRSLAFAPLPVETAAASAPVVLELEAAEQVERGGGQRGAPGGGAACAGPGPMTDIPGTGPRY